MANQTYTLPSTNIDPRIYSLYAPQFQAGVAQIQQEGNVARNDVYTQLAKRGLLSSSMLPTTLNDLNSKVTDAISALGGNISSEMLAQQITLDEARRAEEEAKKWGLFTAAMSFFAPAAGNALAGLFNRPTGSAGINQVLNGIPGISFASPTATAGAAGVVPRP